MSGRLKVKLLVTLPAGTMEELLTPAHHRHAIGLQVRRHLQHAHGMRSLCKGRRSGVGLHAEGEGCEERQVASEPHDRGEGVRAAG
jgi:hypothetical protein